MTVWQLRNAAGELRPDLYDSKCDAIGSADHGDEAEEVDVPRDAVVILAPWLLDCEDA